jgi:IS5 family transposase
VERAGTPLACLVTPANAHDSWYLRPLVQRLAQRVGALVGCKGHADKGYDQPRNRAALTEVGATDRIARKGIDTGGLGRHRHVVERSFSHLSGLHRLERCYERDRWQHLAFLQIGCILKLARKISNAGC